MRKTALSIGMFATAVMGISIGTAGAGWDDSHGYRGLRAYGADRLVVADTSQASRSACTRDDTRAITDSTCIANEPSVAGGSCEAFPIFLGGVPPRNRVGAVPTFVRDLRCIG